MVKSYQLRYMVTDLNDFLNIHPWNQWFLLTNLHTHTHTTLSFGTWEKFKQQQHFEARQHKVSLESLPQRLRRECEAPPGVLTFLGFRHAYMMQEAWTPKCVEESEELKGYEEKNYDETSCLNN